MGNTPVGVIVTPAQEPIKVLAMAIQNQMGIPDGQIMLGLENWAIPSTDTGLYIALFYGADQWVGNNNYNSADLNGNYQEVQSAILLHDITIDIMSFDSSARVQKEGVMQALQSSYALSLMEKYEMRFARTPASVTPVPNLESAKMLNRFQISVLMNAIHTTILTADYFDALQKVKLTVQP